MFCNNCGEISPDDAKFCPICGSNLQEIRKNYLRKKGISEQAKTDSPEITFYSDNKGVKITNTRAIFGNKTYIMTNLSSISIGETAPNYLPGILVLLLGCICLFIGYIGIYKSQLIIAGFAFLIFGCVILYCTKGVYSVRITSNSGETDTLTNLDKMYIQNIVAAINEAIIKRG